MVVADNGEAAALLLSKALNGRRSSLGEVLRLLGSQLPHAEPEEEGALGPRDLARTWDLHRGNMQIGSERQKSARGTAVWDSH